MLGVGSSAVTYKGYDRLTKKFVAIKVIKIDRRSPLELIMRELYVQKLLSAEPDCYDHVVCYYNSYLIPTNEPKLVILISEFVNGITLLSYLQSEKLFPVDPLLPEAVLLNSSDGTGVFPIEPIMLWSIMYQLIAGLYYMYSKDVVHNDIHDQNIMIDRCTNTIKYIDLGISHIKDCRLPLIIFDQDKAIDIFNVGNILYRLANRYMPQQKFNEQTEQFDYLRSAYAGSNFYDQHFVIGDYAINNLIDQMQIVDCKKRPTTIHLYQQVFQMMILNFGTTMPPICF